ncbi:hypothetical protein [Acetobacterium sp. UBA5834]|jgi:hypothetical protein|uniref:hypothetical protein n=1 Tax=Acetobacterium sp. UBA5834 TaxID=1945907 RepID=UPI00257975BC|nr:hypothetical protein [Acetobacterium sp. UBA5834]
MEYNELFEKYQKLLEENQRLKNENEDYRKRLGLPMTSPYIKNDTQASIEINNIQAVEVVKPGYVTNSSSPRIKLTCLCHCLEAGMMSMQKGGKTKRVNRGILLYV